MGFLAFLLLFQLSEAARGAREQKKQTETQKPFQNSRFPGKKTRIYYSKLKERIFMTYFLVSSLYNMWFLWLTRQLTWKLDTEDLWKTRLNFEQGGVAMWSTVCAYWGVSYSSSPLTHNIKRFDSFKTSNKRSRNWKRKSLRLVWTVNYSMNYVLQCWLSNSRV